MSDPLYEVVCWWGLMTEISSCVVGKEAVMLGFKNKINTGGANKLENVVFVFC